MKISLSWIADHIAVNKKELDPTFIAEQFVAHTAEIDAVQKIHTDVSTLFAVIVTAVTESEVTIECPELKKKASLPARKDVSPGQVYLAKETDKILHWATLIDMGSEKEGLMPALFLEDTSGSWKKAFEAEDTIITIENKTITNRPDLWGHRGIAREIAAFLNKQLVSDDYIYAAKPIKHYDHQSNGQGSFTLEIAPPGTCGQPCNRLAGLYLPVLNYQPSLLWMATRLARIDARPLDMLVDMTNYVMFDIGHPMHAFDAQKIETKKLVGRCAHTGEKIKLLDGDEVTLTESDYVISDGKKAIAVAGVMGGVETAVTRSTSSVLLEAAHFEPTPIRRTATRLKRRSEASARFEKNLDPNQNTHALLRYLKLLEDAGVPFTAEDAIASLGALAQEKVITVSHELIEKKIGLAISVDKVESILTRFGFGVTLSKQGPPIYTVTVPTFRATKDITIPEDIVEEVARFIGYKSITPILPTRLMAAFDTRKQEQMRALKTMLAQGSAMHEVQTYAFFDEEFLRILRYEPSDALRIANPLSEHWQRLITSLVPNLLKTIYTNQGHESLRFFEINRVWFYNEKAIEEQECAGIWYEMKKPVHFYDGKALLVSIFAFLKLEIRWEKPREKLDPWYDPYQTAELWYKDRIIGTAGKIAPLFLSHIIAGDAFIFELDANFLLNATRVIPVYKPLHKYPSTDLDISMIVPIESTVYSFEQAIASSDKRITSVNLIDSFTKAEWTTQKSMTFRFTAYDESKTLTKEDIDSIWNEVVGKVKSMGAEVR